eukprot:3497984-Alexandrium_andersonii.AAC.1
MAGSLVIALAVRGPWPHAKAWWKRRWCLIHILVGMLALCSHARSSDTAFKAASRRASCVCNRWDPDSER